jgi:hypothetical protein
VARGRARLAAVLATAACAMTAVACQAGGPAADAFEVIRSGSIPGADITVVPVTDGTVLCNRHSHELPDKLLLTAENFDFTYQSQKHLTLASGPHPVYTYVVRTADGTFSYSDDSPHLGPELRKLAAWTFTVVNDVCR